MEDPLTRAQRAAQARRGQRGAKVDRGHCLGSTQDPTSGQVHVSSSVVAQIASGGSLDRGVGEGNVRYKKIAGRGRRNVLFIVDASGSMLSSQKLAMVKGCIASLLEDAYVTRTRVAVVSFGGGGARLVLPFTSSAELAATRVGRMKGGGTTPLLEALGIAARQMDAVEGEPLSIVLLSDGRYNRNKDVPTEKLIRQFGEHCRKRNVRLLLVDAGHGGKTSQKRAAFLARLLQAQYRLLDDMRAESLVDAARG